MSSVSQVDAARTEWLAAEARVEMAQRDLLVSQIAEVRSVIQYRIALIRLFLAEGSLMHRRGIVMQQ
ncbi:MAG: hypothetical protein U5K27_13540 [Desulfotignum sp.]|nr:hypothetical protein [Desulfotignum sp.]